jgi:hypothetical protein
MAKHTAFLIIATGDTYVKYANNLVQSMRTHLAFDHSAIAFTDNVVDGAYNYHIEPKGYPRETLMRYHTILGQSKMLEQYDQLFYLDADMEFVNTVELEDIESPGLTATLHPGFLVNNIKGTCEYRLESSAFCNHNVRYYAGGFQGGNAQTYLWAMRDMKQRIDQDELKGITAVWHDESHWNSLLADYPPKKILNPSYCFPEDYNGGYGWEPDDYPPVLVALDKHKRNNHPRFK